LPAIATSPFAANRIGRLDAPARAGPSSAPMTTPTAWAVIRLGLRFPTPPSLEVFRDAADRLEALGPLLLDDADVGGVETRDATTITKVERPELWIYTVPDALPRLRAQAAALAEDFGLDVDVTTEAHDDDEWRDGWKRFYRPLRFGADGPSGAARLLVRPSWIARAEDDPACEVVLDPGRAFGTGLHESTRLALELLCRLPGSAVEGAILDLGCGSGILALAARALRGGAEAAGERAAIDALDLDDDAVETTVENVELAHAQAEIRVAKGSLDVAPEPSYRLILANIRPDVLIPHAPAIVARLAPGGAAVLSGILDHEADEVARAYVELGLAELERVREGGWTALRVGREGAA
jgi:ribosomal protein L11 methyltransferase